MWRSQLPNKNQHIPWKGTILKGSSSSNHQFSGNIRWFSGGKGCYMCHMWANIPYIGRLLMNIPMNEQNVVISCRFHMNLRCLSIISASPGCLSIKQGCYCANFNQGLCWKIPIILSYLFCSYFTCLLPYKNPQQNDVSSAEVSVFRSRKVQGKDGGRNKKRIFRTLPSCWMLKSGPKQMWPGELTWQQKFFCYDRTYIFKWCSFQLQYVCSPKCRCQLLWKGMILHKKCLPSIRNSLSDTVAEVDVPTYEGKRNVTFVLQNSHVIQVLSLIPRRPWRSLRQHDPRSRKRVIMSWLYPPTPQYVQKCVKELSNKKKHRFKKTSNFRSFWKNIFQKKCSCQSKNLWLENNFSQKKFSHLPNELDLTG